MNFIISLQTLELSEVTMAEQHSGRELDMYEEEEDWEIDSDDSYEDCNCRQCSDLVKAQLPPRHQVQPRHSSYADQIIDSHPETTKPLLRRHYPNQFINPGTSIIYQDNHSICCTHCQLVIAPSVDDDGNEVEKSWAILLHEHLFQHGHASVSLGTGKEPFWTYHEIEWRCDICNFKKDDRDSDPTEFIMHTVVDGINHKLR